MRKIIFIISIIVTGVGLAFAFSYKSPGYQTYLKLSNIDKKIENELKVNDSSLVKNITQLHQSVQDLIIVGENYTEETEVNKKFEDFNQAYELSKQLGKQIDEFMDKDVTLKLEKPASKLTKKCKEMANETINLERERLKKLKNINQNLQILIKKLANIEDTLYNDKGSEAVQYFNDINNEFENIKKGYEEYVEITNQYFEVKERLYEVLTTT